MKTEIMKNIFELKEGLSNKNPLKISIIIAGITIIEIRFI
tara:strand:+ start:1494 stop:1613 length:120 start_codon:yes stop_codon:yes gene_type:complete